MNMSREFKKGDIIGVSSYKGRNYYHVKTGRDYPIGFFEGEEEILTDLITGLLYIKPKIK